MQSDNDTFVTLVSYIRSYDFEYFENNPVDCKIFIPEQIEFAEQTGEKRRNLFLSVKETLNHVLQHSKALELRIEFNIDKALTVKIMDKGVGTDLQKVWQFGNGLKNIASRMESIGSAYIIQKKRNSY